MAYLHDWGNEAKANNYFFLSENTYHGLIVTLKATLGVMNFLCDNYGYEYLMTAKLNQDALERFFGMMRSACGSNDHPDSRLFIQMFRLISTYSLVKPPKGSNIEGSDLLRSLLNVEEIVKSEENAIRLRNSLDSLMESGIWFNNSDNDNVEEHNYNAMRTSNFVLSYVSGYVARKASRFSKCEKCLQHIQSVEPQNGDQLIEILSRGFLIFPSVALRSLILTIESTVLEVLSTNQVHQETLFDILSKLEDKCISFVGCDEHKEQFTTSIIRFYIISRMHFICKQANRTDQNKKEKTRWLRKQSKL